MTVCKRCGQCCNYIIDGVQKKCRYLIELPDKTTLCRIYKHRLGKIIDKSPTGTVIICCDRETSGKTFPGCPYNLLIKAYSENIAQKTHLQTNN